MQWSILPFPTRLALRSCRPASAARLAVCAAALAALLLPALPAEAELGPRAWGVRAGAASDPDQAMAGLHLDLGEIVDDVRLQPSLELGFGDADSIQLIVPAHVSFYTGGDWTPYVGGGVVLAWIDYEDRPRRRGILGGDDDDTEFDIAPMAVGGLEWSLASGNELLFELQISSSEAFDAKVLVGWSF